MFDMPWCTCRLCPSACSGIVRKALRKWTYSARIRRKESLPRDVDKRHVMEGWSRFFGRESLKRVLYILPGRVFQPDCCNDCAGMGHVVFSDKSVSYYRLVLNKIELLVLRLEGCWLFTLCVYLSNVWLGPDTWAFVTPFCCTWLWLVNKKWMARPLNLDYLLWIMS